VVAEMTVAAPAKAQAPAFGLPASAVLALQTVLRAHPGVEQAIVYGSRAKGNFRPGSDLDLTLVGSGLAFNDLVRIDSDIDDLMLPWKVDLSLRAHIDDAALLDHIARVGKVLWSKNETAD